MGQRSSADTIANIFQAFLGNRSWTQADLAREVGIGVPALRKRLLALEAAGMPLQRDDDHPHVWWSVPKGWFPGAVAFEAADTAELLRLLCRLPAGRARDRLLRRIISNAPMMSQGDNVSALVTPTMSATEETCLATIQDSAARKLALSFRYYTASRGAAETRQASVQRIVMGPPTRAIAVCHRDGRLKWFRIDNMFSPHIAPEVAFRSASPEAVEGLLSESLGGFHAGTDSIYCSFTVREPEARWVPGNLPGAMSIESIDGGIRVSVKTAGVLPLARFVVGLGASAHAETPELAAMVRELASGALHEAAPRDGDDGLNERAVGSKQSTSSEQESRYINPGGRT